MPPCAAAGRSAKASTIDAVQIVSASIHTVALSGFGTNASVDTRHSRQWLLAELQDRCSDVPCAAVGRMLELTSIDALHIISASIHATAHSGFGADAAMDNTRHSRRRLLAELQDRFGDPPCAAVGRDAKASSN